MPYKGGKREKATLSYDENIYTPEGVKTLTDKQMRAEYSRLRSIARKRLERFEGTEWTDTQVYKLNQGKYKPLKDIKNERELRYLLSDLARFISADTGSVKGLKTQRDKAIASLNERGYDFVNKDNFRQFGEFMEYTRIVSKNRIYDSERIAQFFEEAKEKNRMSNSELQKTFRKWSKKQQKQQRIENKNPRNSLLFRQRND